MLEQIADFDAEVRELADLLESVGRSDWERITQFKGWTVNDVVLHLYASDYMAMASVQSPEAFAALRSDMMEQRAGGLSMIEESRRRFPNLEGPALLEEWRTQAAELCRRLDAKDPKERLSWPGPGMAVRMFATARQMETWAHGQEVYDILGFDRTAQDRVANIAFLGAKTFEWSFINRGVPVPAVAPYIELSLPSGRVWSVNNPDVEETVIGEAVDFCQVVTQVRHVADTRLNVIGTTADVWMRIAQCFAGPPANPPAPGTRFRLGPVRTGQHIQAHR